MKLRYFFCILSTLGMVSSLQADRGGAVAGGMLGGLALGSFLSQPRTVYIEQPRYEHSADYWRDEAEYWKAQALER